MMMQYETQTKKRQYSSSCRPYAWFGLGLGLGLSLGLGLG